MFEAVFVKEGYFLFCRLGIGRFTDHGGVLKCGQRPIYLGPKLCTAESVLDYVGTVC